MDAPLSACSGGRCLSGRCTLVGRARLASLNLVIHPFYDTTPITNANCPGRSPRRNRPPPPLQPPPLSCSGIVVKWRERGRVTAELRYGAGVHAPSAGLMPTEARGKYLPEAPYLRETNVDLSKRYACERVDTRQWHEWHSQPLESTRHAGN